MTCHDLFLVVFMLDFDEINQIIQASSVGGTKHNVSTEYVLKVLGLDMCSDMMHLKGFVTGNR